MNEHFDMNTWVETYRQAFSSFGKAQQDGFKALERFARFNYAVAGDVLEAGLAQAKVTLAPKAVAGTQAIAELLQQQADLGSELSEKLKARAEEFTAMAAKALAPSGIYAVNVGDGPPLAHARRRVATVQSVFTHACVIAEAAVLRGRRFGNLVIAAAGHELPVSELTRLTAADPFPARVVEGDALAQVVAGAEPIVDAHARPSPPMPPEVFA